MRFGSGSCIYEPSVPPPCPVTRLVPPFDPPLPQDPHLAVIPNQDLWRDYWIISNPDPIRTGELNRTLLGNRLT